MNNILLVEDDMALAIGMDYTLKQENFNVIKAKNLREARENFNEEMDLVLLDVMLPDGTGYDFCSEIRRKSDIPIIFITACDEEANIVLGLEIGGDDYITKPIRIKEMLARINAVLRRKSTANKEQSTKTIVSGDIVVDILKIKVYKNNEEIILTPAEYKLLVIFMKNKNNVVTRGTLLEKIWDVDGEFVDSNTLNVYVKRLREKIEDDSKNPMYIETVRGAGYRWREKVYEK
ncbi:response regulator transcription factor [Clostridium botulinum]|uniref:response regulator transcription factor n=1 Tax=Clostridium botulinum TaxID=1491 RepID=UPI0002EB567E|nr:response regulator transcription factor [Clostridium botulinum]KLU76981.1 transcriptional regulator [Clostridium botulinum V891]KOA73975.1 transcriptional regulator [Clostridium botulinum]KOA92862.1 transcriptional regulator [Clostridium botulinum]KOC34215.1 transcriptional regulator [Clostridium botulinum]MCD3201760.1 response regulator transcription factor [Clostridium botulinum C/D]